MNKHIELVEKWLKDENSVSLEELKANKDAAYAAYDASNKDAAYYAADAAADAADAYAAADAAAEAAYYVKRYKELTKEDA